MEIKTTKGGYFSTKESLLVQEYLNICTSALPESIEIPYVKLASELFRYNTYVLETTRNQDGLDSNALSMNRKEKEKAGYESVEEETLDQIKALIGNANGSLSVDAWQQLTLLAQLGSKNSKDLFVKSEVLSEQKQEYTDRSLTTGNQQIALQQSVVNLSNTLKEIGELDVDGEKRIDRVKVTEKHMKRIDELPNLSLENKNALKNILISYTNMRVQCFKTVEKLANRAVLDYKKNQLCAFYSLDDPDYSLYSVVGMGLLFQNTYLDENLRPVIDSNFDINDYMENLQTDINCMNMTNLYLMTGTIDREKVDYLIKEGTRYSGSGTIELLTALSNSQAQVNGMNGPSASRTR